MVTVYWKAGASGNASTVANWNTALDGSGTDQAPATGDDVIFAQGGNCTWDIAGTTAIPNSITLATGYTGTITQGDVDISIGAGGFTQQAGTWTGASTKTITSAGSFTVSGGTLTSSTVRLIMTGDGTTMTIGNRAVRSFQASANVTINHSGTTSITTSLTVDSGKTLTLSGTGYLQFRHYTGSTYTNAGTITGGTLQILHYNADPTITFGVVNSAVRVDLISEAVASHTLTLGANTVLGSSLTISSAHASNTITLNLNSKSLTCASLSIGARGVLTGTGTLTADSITVGASGLFTDTNVTYDKTKVVGQTITWIAAEAANASATTSWSLDRAPFHNDNVVFDATSTNNCAWDIDKATVTVNSISLNAGYTGTVTQGAVDIGIGAGGYSQASGKATFNEAKTVTCAGSFDRTDGTISNDGLRLIMTGSGTTATVYGVAGWTFRSLQVSADITITYTGAMVPCTRGLTVDSGKTLTIPTGKQFDWAADTYGGQSFSNHGTIAGAGTFGLQFYANDRTITLGAVNCTVKAYLSASAAASRTLTLGANATLGGALTVQSAHATYTITLDTSTYTLTCGALTLGARGVISQGTGTLTCSSYTQNGASSVFTQGGPVVVSGDTAVSDGTLTGLATATWTAGGNWTTSGSATVTASVLNLIMSGDGKTISGTINVRSLRLSGNTTITSWMIVNWAGLSLIVDAGKNLHFAAGGIDLRVYIGTSINIAGTTSSVGTGKLLINLRSAGITADLHNVGSALEIRCRSNVDGNYAVTASAPVNCITLTIASDHASYKATLDTAGHSLTARGITVGTRGVLLGGEGVIRNYGDFDSSAGTWTPETCQYIQMGNGTVKLAAGQSFYDYLNAPGVTETLASDVTVSHEYGNGGMVIPGAFALTASGASYDLNTLPVENKLALSPVIHLGGKRFMRKLERVL